MEHKQKRYKTSPQMINWIFSDLYFNTINNCKPRKFSKKKKKKPLHLVKKEREGANLY